MKLRNIFGAGENLESTVSYGVETNTPLIDSSDTPFKSALGSSFQVRLCIYVRLKDIKTNLQFGSSSLFIPNP